MSTATVFDVRAGAGAATSKATAPANNMSLFIRISSPPGSRYRRYRTLAVLLELFVPSAAVTDSDGVASRVEVPRPRLVGRHVDAVCRRALYVRRREDAT